VKRSARWAERAFVVEGLELTRTAMASGAVPEVMFIASGTHQHRGVAQLASAALDRGAKVFDLAPGVAERVSDTVTPQPTMTVFPMCDTALSALESLTLVLVCVDVRDPGNLGTILRSAAAAAADAVICCGTTVDPFNPKAVRASAGSIFHVPLVVMGSAGEALGALRDSGVRRVGATVAGGEDYLALDWTLPTAIVLGNEATGLGSEVIELLDGLATIPMPGRAESLNVGMAAAVLCFEAVRQRRCAAAGGATPTATRTPGTVSASTMPAMVEPTPSEASA